MIRKITSRWYCEEELRMFGEIPMINYLKFVKITLCFFWNGMQIHGPIASDTFTGNAGSKKHFTNFTVGTCYRKLHLLTKAEFLQDPLNAVKIHSAKTCKTQLDHFILPL